VPQKAGVRPTDFTHSEISYSLENMPLSYFQGPHKNAGETAIPRDLASLQGEALGMKGYTGLRCSSPFSVDPYPDDDAVDNLPVDLRVTRPPSAEHQIVSLQEWWTRDLRLQICESRRRRVGNRSNDENASSESKGHIQATSTLLR
jgi:hypothetical protein